MIGRFFCGYNFGGIFFFFGVYFWICNRESENKWEFFYKWIVKVMKCNGNINE